MQVVLVRAFRDRACPGTFDGVRIGDRVGFPFEADCR